jgi:hypothetical protein
MWYCRALAQDVGAGHAGLGGLTGGAQVSPPAHVVTALACWA